jgi:hypothetical protein
MGHMILNAYVSIHLKSMIAIQKLVRGKTVQDVMDLQVHGHVPAVKSMISI